MNRAYSIRLLVATIAPNLVPLVLKKMFLLEMVKNGICLGGASKQNGLFSKKCVPKNAPMSSLSRIDPDKFLYFGYVTSLSNISVTPGRICR